MHSLIRLFLICNIDGILSIIAFFSAYWLRLESFPTTPIISTLIVFFSTIFSFILLPALMNQFVIARTAPLANPRLLGLYK